MRRKPIAAFAVVLITAGAILAQAPPQMPKPGAEHKRLHYFVGKWNFDYDMKESPFGPGGKVTGTDRNEMWPGGYFLVMHSDGKGPMGQLKGLSVMGYNAQEKVYTYYGVNNLGEAETSKGTVEGDTWTWTSESEMGGKKIKTRFNLKEDSPKEYTMKFDMSSDGGEWKMMMEGKATKVK